MLDADTKRRIDTARDILVGKVPDPKSQVEQITIALIYKFMDDIDAESEELGGRRAFFAGAFARYSWAKLMRSGLGGHETLSLYAEAIVKMPENPGIPPLFRGIFNNAYLPYRDPETLRAFLKVIDEFTYDHSERLGDAFEYLLSVLGAQGDAGQFRTPRHIIDFMVSVTDPKKDESLLDPACGTAGFLISSYKHILKANSGAEGRGALTPDEKGNLAANVRGYDISPDMVRLSLVNLYLHGFVEPRIVEYDTLTSEDRWNERADVILANPPFMSPKGGIRPHNRFSVQSKRSEVLFVDYIAEHLTPNGRAGIIVPEGVIFQGQTAYRRLRKLLVEEFLVAVVSLPAGVFQPYSGVKTSILILDRALARKTRRIAFFKVENDGFDLGAQRRKIEKNDLPRARAEIAEYLRRLRAGESADGFESAQATRVAEPGARYAADESAAALGLIAEKEKIAANGEYNLSGERYRESKAESTEYDWVELSEVILSKPQYGSTARKVSYDGKVRYVRITDITDDGELKPDDVVSPSIVEPDRFLKSGDLLIARSGSVGRTYLHEDISGIYQYAGYLIRFRIDRTKAIPQYVYNVTKSDSWHEWILSNSKTGTLTNINAKQYSAFRFPLPPLEVQREIVAEIEGYQKVIDGARAVVDNYHPHIAIDPEWPMVALGNVCNFKRGPFGGSLKKEIFVTEGYAVYEQSHAISDDFSTFRYFIDEIKYETMKGFKVHPNDIIMSCSGTMGRTAVVPRNAPAGIINQALLKLSPTDRINTDFLKLWMDSINFQQSIENVAFGAAIRNVASVKVLKGVMIPLPRLATQQALVAEIEAEQALVNANRELIDRMEGKIQAAIGRVWNEEKDRRDDNNRELEISSSLDHIPSGLDHVKMIAMFGEKNRRLSGSKLGDYKDDINVLGTSLSILYQVATCHRNCFGGPHVLESLTGRTYNLACSAYTLICRGLYDEALNLIRSMGEISNLIALFFYDKEACKLWLHSDKRKRLREFSPAGVRKSLSKYESIPMYADQDWYSKFCENYTHVHPGTRPNVHNKQALAHAGGCVQEED